jgi:hypothetical protein
VSRNVPQREEIGAHPRFLGNCKIFGFPPYCLNPEQPNRLLRSLLRPPSEAMRHYPAFAASSLLSSSVFRVLSGAFLRNSLVWPWVNCGRSVVPAYFFGFCTERLAWAVFFFCAALSDLAFCCAFCFWFAFGDLSPMMPKAQPAGWNVNADFECPGTIPDRSEAPKLVRHSDPSRGL